METLGEKDTDDIIRVDLEQGQSVDSSNQLSTHELSNTKKQTQVATTGSIRYSQVENMLSQSSSNSQPLSQDISATVDSDSEIEDFEDDLIW